MGKKRTLGGTLVIIVFFGSFAALGSIALYISSEGAYYGTLSGDWPTTEGKMIESRIKTRRKKGKKKRLLVIKYAYQVNGSRHINNKAQYLDNVFYSTTRKKEIVSQFPAGKIIPVYYNPDNPSQSVLFPGFSTGSFFGGIALGSIFMGIGMWGLVHLRKE